MDWEKKESILEAAAEAFGQFGLRKASIDQIAVRAGVAKGTVYNACTSKEDLFYQVLHREVRAWTAEVSKVIDPAMPADELLKLASELSVSYLDRRPLVRQLLFREAHSLVPSYKEKLDALCDIGLENVVSLLMLGQGQGVFREDLDLPVVATLLQDLSLAFFLLHDRERPDRAEFIRRRQAAGLDLIFNGIRQNH